MNISFKDYLEKTLQTEKNDIQGYKDLLLHFDTNEKVDEKCKKELNDFILQEENIIYAGELMLKELF